MKAAGSCFKETLNFLRDVQLDKESIINSENFIKLIENNLNKIVIDVRL